MLDDVCGFAKKPRLSSTNNPTQALASGSNVWLPMHLQARWKDRMLREHVTVAMALPSGLIADGLQGKLFPSVSNDGKTLTVKCAWPTLLSDTDSMEIGWSRRQGLTTRELVNAVVSMEEEIKDLRKKLNITRGDQCTSTATIKLTKECEREIVNMITVTDNERGGIVVYLVLKVRIEETEEGEIDMSIQDINHLKSAGAQLSTKMGAENMIFGSGRGNNITNLGTCTPRAKVGPKGKRKCRSTISGTENSVYNGKSQNFM